MDPSAPLGLGGEFQAPSLAPLVLSFQLLAFFWGASWGSFLNVVIYRMPLGLSIVSPGSRCSQCLRPIRFYDNIPVLSYLWLRGRCRHCKSAYGARYMLIEALLGTAALLLFNAIVLPLDPVSLSIDLLLWLWALLFAGALVALALIDLEHFFLPDEITLPLIMLGVVGGLMLPQVDGLSGIWGALLGGGVILAVWLLGWALYRREAMGLGDAKLMAAIGAFLGWQALPLVLLGAALQALLAVAFAQLYGRFTGQQHLVVPTETLDAYFGEGERFADLPSRLALPFGPFLSLAALEVLFFGTQPFYGALAQLSALIGLHGPPL